MNNKIVKTDVTNKGSYSAEQKQKILAYLASGKVIYAMPAVFRDPITNQPLSIETNVLAKKGIEDGFYWRSDLPYLIENYDVALPEDVLKAILNG